MTLPQLLLAGILCLIPLAAYADYTTPPTDSAGDSDE